MRKTTAPVVAGHALNKVVRFTHATIALGGISMKRLAIIFAAQLALSVGVARAADRSAPASQTGLGAVVCERANSRPRPKCGSTSRRCGNIRTRRHKSVPERNFGRNSGSGGWSPCGGSASPIAAPRPAAIPGTTTIRHIGSRTPATSPRVGTESPSPPGNEGGRGAEHGLAAPLLRLKMLAECCEFGYNAKRASVKSGWSVFAVVGSGHLSSRPRAEKSSSVFLRQASGRRRQSSGKWQWPWPLLPGF